MKKCLINCLIFWLLSVFSGCSTQSNILINSYRFDHKTSKEEIVQFMNTQFPKKENCVYEVSNDNKIIEQCQIQHVRSWVTDNKVLAYTIIIVGVCSIAGVIAIGVNAAEK